MLSVLSLFLLMYLWNESVQIANDLALFVCYLTDYYLVNQNGGLLRSCIYLGNDSSYSVSADDGVEISVLHNYSATDEENLNEFRKFSPKSSDPTAGESTTSNQMKNTSFEIQVPSYS